MDGTRPDALTDTQLNQELEAALGVEPSPGFLARVRTRIATEPQASAWRLAEWTRAVEPMWAVGVAGIVLAIVVPQLMRDESARLRTVAANVADAPHAAVASVPAGPALQPMRANPISRPAPPAETGWGRTVPLQLSPVLIAEDEQRAFTQLVAAVQQGLVPEKVLEAAPIEVLDLPALSIAPLEIDPLPSLARVQGEGEDQWE